MKKYFGLLVLILTSCVSSRQMTYFQEGDLPSSVKMGVDNPIQEGDALLIAISAADASAVSFYNLPIMSNGDGAYNCRVSQSGMLSLPRLNPIHVAGMNEQEVVDTLTAILEKEVQKPIVSLQRIGQYITVLGEVNYPGRKSIVTPVTMTEVLGMAGDIRTNGRRDNVLVIRKEGNRLVEYHINLLSHELFSSPCYQLRQGDVIIVSPKYGKIR